MGLKIGDSVKQIVPVIEGTIVDMDVDKSTSKLRYLVEKTGSDENGDDVNEQFWFFEEQLTFVAGATVEGTGV